MQNSYNKFDNVFLNIKEEFEKQNQLLSKKPKNGKESNFLFNILSVMFGLFLALLYKCGILQKLFYSNMRLKWFFDFKKFWVDYLGNRNIDVIDFHFLRDSYRAKFQDVSLEHTDEKNPEKFLASWQGQGNIFYLFQSVWNYSKKAYLDCWLFVKFIKKNSHVLEYGCSVAPITQGLIKYFGYKNLKFTIADIPQIAFLYARWKLMTNKRVGSIVLNPSQKNNLPQNVKYNTIVCLTVFEHLPNPIEVVEGFLSHLEKGGVLIFDYIKGEAGGLNSIAGEKERIEVLKIIERNFKVLKGKIDFENSMGLTIAQIKND
ncbi:MAG: methyltransferase domain-containing protein [Candidatus Pacebacteria bacterium]|nr:methyltransferase domain-containing protein [Candidatus Paceibacterota bacterium]